MYCPNCQMPCGDADLHCANCGMPLNRQKVNKKGSHWVPILIMVILCVFGTGLFFVFPMGGISGGAGSSVGDAPWFQIESGVLYFSERDYDGGSELTVPETVAGQKVLALGEGCFENCTDLTAVSLPDTLQAIGADAFRGCTALRGVDIPGSVRLIGEGAFFGCTGLEAICLSDQTQAIGDGAFANCRRLNYVFFLGNFEDWSRLYGEYINPNTAVFCDDGSFYQGGDPNEIN